MTSIFNITTTFCTPQGKSFTHVAGVEADTLQEGIKRAHKQVYSGDMIPPLPKEAKLIHLSVAVA